MIQIRQQVFETNSSSTHSIVIQKKRRPVKPNDLPHHSDYASCDQNGLVTIHEDNYFGCGWEVLDCWIDRLAYAIADLDDVKREELVSDLSEQYNIHVKIGYKDAYWIEEGKYPDYGDVDHQSQGTLQEMLSDIGIKAIDFVFDDRFIVVLDNDNCDDERYNAYVAKLDVEEEYPKDRFW